MQENLLTATKAVYRILDFLPESDPLKNKAKEKALAILEQSGDVVKNIELLEQYLAIGKAQGWISDMNFLIITKAYRELKSLVKKSPTLASPTDSPKVENPPSHKASARQRKILDILSKSEKLQVKDILAEIPTVTKRTLRRDLDDLLKKGQVVRIGSFNAVFYQKAVRTNMGQ